jgi:hypothetical protein
MVEEDLKNSGVNIISDLFSHKHNTIYILIENQQMYQNDHFIVMSSQTLQQVSAY